MLRTAATTITTTTVAAAAAIITAPTAVSASSAVAAAAPEASSSLLLVEAAPYLVRPVLAPAVVEDLEVSDTGALGEGVAVHDARHVAEDVLLRDCTGSASTTPTGLEPATPRFEV